MTDSTQLGEETLSQLGIGQLYGGRKVGELQSSIRAGEWVRRGARHSQRCCLVAVIESGRCCRRRCRGYRGIEGSGVMVIVVAIGIDDATVCMFVWHYSVKLVDRRIPSVVGTLGQE